MWVRGREKERRAVSKSIEGNPLPKSRYHMKSQSLKLHRNMRVVAKAWKMLLRISLFEAIKEEKEELYYLRVTEINTKFWLRPEILKW